MKKVLKIAAIVLGSLIILILGLVILAMVSDNGVVVLPVKHKAAFEHENKAQFPSRLHAEGNKIVDSNGETVIFKGLMAPDPQKLNSRNKFKRAFYEGISEKGANVIRIPVHPDRWVKDGDYMWRYLDPIVAWAGEMNMYAIIDWHYIGNVSTGAGREMPDIKEEPKELTREFWKHTAEYFKDVPNVIFEIYNEPADIGVDEWYSSAKDIVKTIRDMGAEQLVIIGGVDYSYDLSWVEKKPVIDSNAAYASHVYPVKNFWDHFFGDVSKEFPVVITEWGFMDENRDDTKQTYLIGDEESFGKSFMDYLEQRGIGWVACWYDDTWEPPMFTEDFKDITNFGKFIFKELKK